MKNTIGLPSGIHGKCFRVMDDHLRNNPLLRSAGVTIFSWRGDVIDKATPTLAQSPWVRLTPGGRTTEQTSERQTDSPLIVNLELFVSGLIAENITDFWDYIVQSFYPGDQTVMAALGLTTDSTGSPTTYHVGEPAFQVQMDGGQPVGFYARGTVLVKIRVSTNY